jgi:hypothetical protein
MDRLRHQREMLESAIKAYWSFRDRLAIVHNEGGIPHAGLEGCIGVCLEHLDKEVSPDVRKIADLVRRGVIK